jgi:hypothetical protein
VLYLNFLIRHHGVVLHEHRVNIALFINTANFQWIIFLRCASEEQRIDLFAILNGVRSVFLPSESTPETERYG